MSILDLEKRRCLKAEMLVSQRNDTFLLFDFTNVAETRVGLA